MTHRDQPAPAADCATPGCNRPAEYTLTAVRVAGLREITRRCKPCAATTAWRRLTKGYAVIIDPLPTAPGETERVAHVGSRW